MVFFRQRELKYKLDFWFFALLKKNFLPLNYEFGYIIREYNKSLFQHIFS